MQLMPVWRRTSKQSMKHRWTACSSLLILLLLLCIPLIRLRLTLFLLGSEAGSAPLVPQQRGGVRRWCMFWKFNTCASHALPVRAMR